jgi:hypothetical protein
MIRRTVVVTLKFLIAVTGTCVCLVILPLSILNILLRFAHDSLNDGH